MRYYRAEELRAAADLRALIDALDAGHKGARPEMVDGLIGPQSSRYLIRSAHDGEGLLGSKLITILPDNPEQGRAAVQALIVLFNANDGTPVAALDATELTYWKTSADSALGSRYLSQPDAHTLVMVGAGGLASWLVRGHCTERPEIKRVIIWNRTAEKARELAQVLNEEGFPAEPTDNLEQAVRQGDIISTATMSREPIIKGDLLKGGCHLDLVGGYAPDTREADDSAISGQKLFVDCMESALDGVGDILNPLERGVIAKSDIRGDLFDLASGKIKGRENANDITVFKNAGGAHLDLMVAGALIKRLEQTAS